MITIPAELVKRTFLWILDVSIGGFVLLCLPRNRNKKLILSMPTNRG